MRVRIGTRGSKLALWQARLVSRQLTNAGFSCEIVKISTEGDRVQDVPLHQVGAIGIFTKALDNALLSGEIDLAVHSAKDMPSALEAGLETGAFLKREDPRDVLLALSENVHFENQSEKFVIGTSALRRKAFLRHYFQNIEVKDIRGNVDTRIQKLKSGDYDGILLAYAGVKRMGMERYIVQKLNTSSFTPAVGQGAIAVLCRKGWDGLPPVREVLNHTATELALHCERSYLRTVEGGCKTPVFGFATVTGDRISLMAGIAEEDGSRIRRNTLEGTSSRAESIGRELANVILTIQN